MTFEELIEGLLMATGPFPELGVANPVLAAPMAGGPSTPELVVAASSVGSLGFLAAGYKTPDLLRDQIGTVRSHSVPFGVNLFVPNPIPVDLGEFDRYSRLIQPEAEHFGLSLDGASPIEDDDNWESKVELLLSQPVPVVSFTFAIPDRTVLAALHKVGTTLLQTVTSVDEARSAEDRGVDGLVVQSFEAGAHWGTLTPDDPPERRPLVELVEDVRGAVGLPMLAAGGIADSGGVSAILRAGAAGVMVGTVLLRSDESGASAPHKAALADRRDGRTIVTRAFTGRSARAIPNRFTDRFDALAPSGYPAVHHLTTPIRRAAVAAGDAERFNLWAGTGYREARPEPAAKILTRLAEGT
jgi:NAD(P)H-dependent flavin oxidoreductase YrpB (nitropropane dioxygenase family)